ncbi:MAG: hypothetical protein ACE5H1_01215 [Thermodesulfobacteriota bacterium]
MAWTLVFGILLGISMMGLMIGSHRHEKLANERQETIENLEAVLENERKLSRRVSIANVRKCLHHFFRKGYKTKEIVMDPKAYTELYDIYTGYCRFRKHDVKTGDLLFDDVPVKKDPEIIGWYVRRKI